MLNRSLLLGDHALACIRGKEFHHKLDPLPEPCGRKVFRSGAHSHVVPQAMDVFRCGAPE